MTCPVCGLEMVIYQVKETEEGGREVVYVCRNRRCARFDQRLKRAEETAEPSANEE